MEKVIESNNYIQGAPSLSEKAPAFSKVKEAAFASIDDIEKKYMKQDPKFVSLGKFEYTPEGILFRKSGSAEFRRFESETSLAVPKNLIDKSLIQTDFITQLNSEYTKRVRDRIGSLESIVGPLVQKVDKSGKFVINSVQSPEVERMQWISFNSGKGIMTDVVEKLRNNPKELFGGTDEKVGVYQVKAIEFAYGINIQQLVGLLNDRLENK